MVESFNQAIINLTSVNYNIRKRGFDYLKNNIDKVD